MERSYRSIFSSSALMGSQQLVLLLVGVVQAKAIAVLLGVSGVGIFGIYGTLLVLAQSIFGLGLSGSGVREIAVRSSEPGALPVAEVVRALQWTALLSAIVGAVALGLFRKPLGLWSFGVDGYANSIWFIAAALVATLWNIVQLAVLQGLRRLKALAAARMIGALLSALSAIALLYFFGAKAIASAYAATGVCALLVSWMFLARLRLPRVALSFRRWWDLSRGLLSLGIGFLAPTLFAAASAYAIRAILAKTEGMQAVGMFQAAWTLTTFYATVVLQAMGIDFLPRLSAAARDRLGLRRLANEQTEAGLIIVIPGLLACLVVAPLLLRLFYTAEFLPAVNVSRWMLLGMMVRAAGWPLAYVPLAMNRPWITAATEAAFNILLILLTMLGVRHYGLEGAGMAFLVSSVVYTLTLLAVGIRFIGFAWSPAVLRLLGFLYVACLSVFVLLRVFPASWSMGFSCVLTAVLGLACGIWALQVLEAGAWLRHFFRCARRR